MGLGLGFGLRARTVDGLAVELQPAAQLLEERNGIGRDCAVAPGVDVGCFEQQVAMHTPCIHHAYAVNTPGADVKQ